MRVQSFPEAVVPPVLARQVRALQRQAWPDDPSGPDAGDPLVVHDPMLRPVSVLLLDGAEQVVAACDILSKTITHHGRAYAVSGLSAVVVDPARRRQGLGGELVSAGYRLMEVSGVDLSLFSCDRPLAPLYTAAGWRVLEGAVLIGGTPSDPFASDRPGFDKVVLGAFFSAAALVHRADFSGARIGLYPGDIDRLW